MATALLLHRADGALPYGADSHAPFGPADPFGQVREIAWHGPGGTAAGRVVFSGEIEVAPYPHIEVLVVVHGALSLTAASAKPLVLHRGEGAVIARGTAVRVQTLEPAMFAFCATAGGSAGQPGITPLHADANFKPSNPPLVELLLGPTPQCRSDNVFKDESTGVIVGTWDSTPYHRIVRPHRVNEFMYLLEGAVRLTHPDGSVLSAVAGDAVLVPEGTPIGWESSTRVAKFFVVQNVPA